jgi:hypothetical protein
MTYGIVVAEMGSLSIICACKKGLSKLLKKVSLEIRFDGEGHLIQNLGGIIFS